MMTSPTNQLLTVEQVAERLHVHPQTVRLWIRQGLLGRHKVGKYSRISEDQLARFLDHRREDV